MSGFRSLFSPRTRQRRARAALVPALFAGIALSAACDGGPLSPEGDRLGAPAPMVIAN